MVSNCSNCFKRCAWLEKKEETFFYISVPWQGLPINDIYPGNSTHSKVVFREVLHPIELVEVEGVIDDHCASAAQGILSRSSPIQISTPYNPDAHLTEPPVRGG